MNPLRLSRRRDPDVEQAAVTADLALEQALSAYTSLEASLEAELLSLRSTAAAVESERAQAVLQAQVDAVLAAGADFGAVNVGNGQRVQVEYVSANPTGPLHVGNGRGGVLGSALSAVLKAAGYNVHQEYYINDTGAQMSVFQRSIWARYLQALGQDVPFPDDGYGGACCAHTQKEKLAPDLAV